MIQSQRNKYMENTVQNATPAQLLIMLIDGATRFCKMGISAIEQKNHAEANLNLGKVQDIVSELIITLDRESSVADGLLRLYEYFNFRLTEANIQKKVEPAQEVLGYLLELKEVWIQAAKSSLAGPAASNVLQHG
ncbi:flagellar export chaperone FliS [Paenibacillus psychroresistens]|uniref:Flagellar secretion chaperone FliS n=1 Tax=Paenibacillus psychroresistens TaxID=1778678 RepID=A0A6B8RD89_9BACL|nr:flagellar export chaperone FliS [Paenibacillus psychroresistens]QGQ93533.1 flagellar export chaperone FliS [Paenibacillus psychroresistens]